ncbi:MAG: hypothetical protein WD749_12850 [Phycisphaerales bacterium]
MTTNPVFNIWRGDWRPTSYSDRTVHFGLTNGTGNPSSQANRLIVRDPTANSTVFLGHGVDNFGAGLSIQIVPAPGYAAIIGSGALVAARRRRPPVQRGTGEEAP